MERLVCTGAGAGGSLDACRHGLAQCIGYASLGQKAQGCRRVDVVLVFGEDADLVLTRQMWEQSGSAHRGLGAYGHTPEQASACRCSSASTVVFRT